MHGRACFLQDYHRSPLGYTKDGNGLIEKLYASFVIYFNGKLCVTWYRNGQALFNNALRTTRRVYLLFMQLFMFSDSICRQREIETFYIRTYRKWFSQYEISFLYDKIRPVWSPIVVIRVYFMFTGSNVIYVEKRSRVNLETIEA